MSTIAPVSPASTNAVNPGVASLLQNLSSIDPAALSSPSVVAALEKAPAGDIVKLSDAALQLQNVQALFGSTDAASTSSSSSDPFAGLLGASTSTTNPAAASNDLLASLYGVSTSGSTTATDPFGAILAGSSQPSSSLTSSSQSSSSSTSTNNQTNSLFSLLG